MDRVVVMDWVVKVTIGLILAGTVLVVYLVVSFADTSARQRIEILDGQTVIQARQEQILGSQERILANFAGALPDCVDQ